jgi:AraC-like DNA-binding protein
MNVEHINNLIIILINGSLVLLAFLKFSNPLMINKKASFWFGGFLLLWSTFWLEEIFSLAGIGDLDPDFRYLLQLIQFNTPLVYYISVMHFTRPDFPFRKVDLIHLIVPAFYMILLTFQHVAISSQNQFIEVLLTVLILFQALLYSAISFLKIRKHQKKIENFVADTNEINLRWIAHISLLMISVTIIVSLYNILNHKADLNIFINLIMLTIIYFVAYYSMKQKEIYPQDMSQRNELMGLNGDESKGSVKKKLLSDEDLAAFMQRLTLLMEEKRPYLEQDLNLLKLSEMLAVTPHQLSYVINTGFNENFFQYINKFRVEKARQLLCNHENDNLSFYGIAFESGFNSKTSFYNTFKKITGQTPSEFRKTCLDL